MKQNAIKHRILKLSPTVDLGIEREASRNDFFVFQDFPIGKGGYASVYKVKHRETLETYAIKVIDKRLIMKAKLEEQVNREIDIMYKLNHPHIIKLINHFEDDDYMYLILELADRGELYYQLKKYKSLDQRTVAQYLREVISAVEYLHSFNPPIIHRDIKPENILLDKYGRCKLADFGWSNYFYEENQNENRKTYCGTLPYLAPEMIKKEGHDMRVDIWAIGILMFELLTGFPPFDCKNPNDLENQITQKKYWKIVNETSAITPIARDLIQRILKPNCKDRLTLQQILEHSWFNDFALINSIYTQEEIDQNLNKENYILSHVIGDKTDEVKNNISAKVNEDNNIFVPPKFKIPALINTVLILKKKENKTDSSEKNQQQNKEADDKSKKDFSNDRTTLGDLIDSKYKGEIGTKNDDKYDKKLYDYIEEQRKTINTLKQKEIELTNKNKLLQETIDGQLRSISEMKKKYDTYALDKQNLENELKKYKIFGNNNNENNQNSLLQEELKVTKKIKLDIGSEIESKDKEIIDLKAKIKQNEFDFDILKKEKESQSLKIKELEAAKDSLELKLKEEGNKFTQYINNKENEILKVKNDYDLFKSKISENESFNKKEGQQKLTIIKDILTESIEELNKTLQIKSETIDNSLNEIIKTTTTADNKFKDILDESTKSLVDNIAKFKNSLIKIFSTKKKEPEGYGVFKERIEWQSKQINDLTSYKTKYADIEVQLKTNESKYKINEEFKKLSEDNYKALQRFKALKEEAENAYKQRIKDLENEIEDLRIFISMHCNLKDLDDFNKMFNKNARPL